MEELDKIYKHHCSRSSDINQHLPTLYKYASECEHVTEFGVRTGVSTWALLQAKPKTLKSYDIDPDAFKEKNKAVEISEKININYNFIDGDTLKVDIEQTDMLFIDS